MFDVVSFVERNFPECNQSGFELQVCCPMCDDSKQHLYINTQRQVCHCFKCGYSNNWVGLVMDVTGLPYYRAIGELYHVPRMRDFHSKIEVKQDARPAVQLPEGFKNILLAEAKRARTYLNNRGITDKQIAHYNLGIAVSVPGRIIIPIEFDYWQGRRLYKWMDPKYINPKNPAKEAVFNSIALSLYEEVVICEGAFSAMAVGDNATALIGKECPQEKLERFGGSKVSKFVVALDSDARKHAMILADKLSRLGKDVEIWEFNSGDPAENDGTVRKQDYNFKTKVEAMLRK